MSDATPSLEDLLDRRLASAIDRHDEALLAGGLTSAEIGATKDALAALARSEAPVSPSSSVRDRLLASRRRAGRFGMFADRVARLFGIPIADAEELMARAERPEAWTSFLVPGLEMIPVMAGPGHEGAAAEKDGGQDAIATLVRIQPGAEFPQHAHRGAETMVVLDGGFREPAEDGEEVWRGDEILRTDGTEHAVRALPGVPCVAAVLMVGYTDLR